MKPTTVPIYGIQELYRPTDTLADVDIVAIHGINGDSKKSWTSEPENICWLNHPDFLPKYIKCARVLTWGYNANITSLTGKTTSSERILQHAQTLREKEAREISNYYLNHIIDTTQLEDAKERPIIFLCHSLGGIIVKRALAYSASRNASKIAHLQSIYTCTYAILFFGTPHHGSSKAHLLGSLQKLAMLSIPKAAAQFESGLLRALEEESETLQNITDQFAPLLCNFCIFFFWEQEKTDLKYTKDYIVDEWSAAPILDNTERSGIASNHRGMCRFKVNTGQDFRTVIAALKRYCLEAPEVISRRLGAASEMLEKRRYQEAVEMLGRGSVSTSGTLPESSGSQGFLDLTRSLSPDSQRMNSWKNAPSYSFKK